MIVTEVNERVGLVKLDRPKQRNALSPELMDALASQLEEWDRDSDINAIVITGHKEAFAIGIDPSSVAQRGAEEILVAESAHFWPRVRGIRTPMVAAVQGYALGGGFELALSCDLIIASDAAEFGLPDIRLGITPGGGATQYLARTIGRQRSLELLLTGRRLTAEEGFEWGFVNKVVSNKQCIDTAFDTARLIAAHPPIAARLAKRAVITAEETHMPEGLAEERRLFGAAMTTEDRVEGVTAFLEGRRPKYTGR